MSLHTLFDKYSDHMLVKFEFVWSEQYKILNFLTKTVNHFWQSVDAILKDASVIETTVWCSTIDLKTIIFQCSKNYGSPTRVTMQYSCIKHGRPSLLKRKQTVALSGPC